MDYSKSRKSFIYILIGLLLLFIFVCYLFTRYDEEYVYSYNSLNIISSSENQILDKDLKRIAQDNDINLNIEYADTLDIMSKLNVENDYDAVFISNSLWLYKVDSKITSVTNSRSLSINPVVFGIKKSKAEELGFVGKKVYTKDIVNAIKEGKLKFSMSNPTSTNSGASAYLGILATLAGNPEVLTKEMLEDDSLKEDLKTFFTGLERTSGSEDFLEELFLKGDYESVVTYESSIININKKLESKNKEPLYAIYPVDGVSISDSVFGYIDRKNESKKALFDKFQNSLLSNDGQKVLEKYGRRTWYGGINKDADKNIFNPEWGIDTTSYITPIKYPSTEVINASLSLYQTELRKPIHVVFCLDYSGSMIGSGIEELQEAMNYVLDKDQASKDYIQFSSVDKIDVIPFDSYVKEVYSTDNGENTIDLLKKINDRKPTGATALYPAAEKALELLKNEDNEKYNLSIILMTDGEGNVGRFSDLKEAYKNTNKDIPIYSIMFGYASEDQLNEIAKLSNAKIFDGKTDLVKAFKEVRGYN